MISTNQTNDGRLDAKLQRYRCLRQLEPELLRRKYKLAAGFDSAMNVNDLAPAEMISRILIAEYGI